MRIQCKLSICGNLTVRLTLSPDWAPKRIARAAGRLVLALPGPTGATPPLRVVAEKGPGVTVPAEARLVQAQGEIRYLADASEFFVVAPGRGILRTDLADGSVTAQVTEDLAADLPLLSNMLLNALAPLLRRRGFYPLHAFAAAWGEQGILLVGTSGSGKTTAGLALVRAGWGFLANDHTLLMRNGEVVDALCCNEPVNVTRTTAGFYPELQHLAQGLENGEKRSFAIESVYGPIVRRRARVALLLFPHVGDRGQSAVTRLSEADALTELLPQGLDAWDKATLPAHFAVLAALAEAAPAYRLRLGRDLEALPALVGALLPSHDPSGHNLR